MIASDGSTDWYLSKFDNIFVHLYYQPLYIMWKSFNFWSCLSWSCLSWSCLSCLHSWISHCPYTTIRETMLFIANLCIIREDTFHGKWRGWWKCFREFYADWIWEFAVTCRHYILLQDILGMRVSPIITGILPWQERGQRSNTQKHFWIFRIRIRVMQIFFFRRWPK